MPCLDWEIGVRARITAQSIYYGVSGVRAYFRAAAAARHRAFRWIPSGYRCNPCRLKTGSEPKIIAQSIFSGGSIYKKIIIPISDPC